LLIKGHAVKNTLDRLKPAYILDDATPTPSVAVPTPTVATQTPVVAATAPTVDTPTPDVASPTPALRPALLEPTSSLQAVRRVRFTGLYTA